MPITTARLPIGGERVCQCSNCNEFFSSTNAFDVHQVRMGRKIVCSHPETCGLEMKISKTGDTFWGQPWHAHKLVQETFKRVGQ